MRALETSQAEREASGARPYGRYLEDFEVGAVYKHWPAKTVTESEHHLFCLITMNHHPLHLNDVYASQSQQGKNVVVGPYVYSLAVGMTVSDVSGKAIANLIFVAAVQMIAIPALAIFYNLPLGQIAAPLVAILLLAAIGLVAVGTLFSAMAVNTRLAELLLPMLALPFFVPIVIGASQATAKLLSGRPIVEAGAWIKLLLAFDIVFVAACTLAYPFTVED